MARFLGMKRHAIGSFALLIRFAGGGPTGGCGGGQDSETFAMKGDLSGVGTASYGAGGPDGGLHRLLGAGDDEAGSFESRSTAEILTGGA